ncbi:hypothetical protein [Faecalibaculum rodentium]|uniref:hypothetical protein n=1 Tax=Faecalibaculum rodentium TaxID=1702221 RepID=UPI0023F33B45|nr:hypothetical protein [Faecalibaculum rodentium]
MKYNKNEIGRLLEAAVESEDWEMVNHLLSTEPVTDDVFIGRGVYTHNPLSELVTIATKSKMGLQDTEEIVLPSDYFEWLCVEDESVVTVNEIHNLIAEYKSEIRKKRTPVVLMGDVKLIELKTWESGKKVVMITIESDDQSEKVIETRIAPENFSFLENLMPNQYIQVNADKLNDGRYLFNSVRMLY